MPKIVNHQQRKEEIAEATWRVIRNEGISGVSVRRIVDELGISLGSLRHYFNSQEDLLSFAMQLISERVNYRIQHIQFTGNPRLDVELIIREITPMNEEQKLESEVWLAFAGESVSHKSMRHILEKVHQELYIGFLRMMILLQTKDLTKEGIHVETEAKRLHALVDGLVLHHTTFPDLLTQDDIAGIVTIHLDSILK
ncbi:TetR family transcriptional regulator C-terminal domain-containing protein [Neobacillus mesonae]|nr:TetR family transcriptional regulator C-terminal domain-containing protein [Neobacillus mesonae]